MNEKKKDIYRWWSRKKLKDEIAKLKQTYNELFDLTKSISVDLSNTIVAKCKVENKLSKARIENRKLNKENDRLLKQHNQIYDCIQKWYEPTSDMTKLVEETRKLFESFMEIVY